MKLATFCFFGLLATASIGCATAPVLDVENFPNERIAYYTAEGGVVMKGQAGTCVMPPAQGVREISSKGSLKIDAKTAQDLSASIDTSGEQNHTAQSLFTRSQGDLFLETMLYRLCEMHANGFLKPGDPWSQDTYKTLVSESMKESSEIIKAEAALEKQKTATAAATAVADTAKATAASTAAAASPSSTPDEKKNADAKSKLLQENLQTFQKLLAPGL